MGDVERWDLTDATGAPLGRRHRRGDPMPPGAFHVVASVCPVRADGRVLVSLRATGKEYPHSWEFAAGSALAGETSAAAAVRELAEETGLAVTEEELRLVGRFVEESALFDLYVAPVSASAELRLQAEEVADAEWVRPSEAARRIEDGQFAAPWPPRIDALGPDLWAAIARIASG